MTEWMNRKRKIAKHKAMNKAKGKKEFCRP